MPPAQRSEHTPSYADIARAFDTDLKCELEDSCKNLARSLIKLVQSFDNISIQLHSLDLQAIIHPVKPKWKRIRKEFIELVSLLRVNALNCSARIRMFSSVILPLACRPCLNQRSYNEKAHVLQSFMSNSAEQATFTFQLTHRAISLNSAVSEFISELSRLETLQGCGAQKELYDLVEKVSLLRNSIDSLYSTRATLVCPNASHLVWTTFRLIMCAGKRSARTKLDKYPPIVDGSISHISQCSQMIQANLDELAHAQYACQIATRTPNMLSTARVAVSEMIPNQFLIPEALLGFLTAIWLQLQADCTLLLEWVYKGGETPALIDLFTSSGSTIYTSFADYLDICAQTIDLD